ncbi:hypothetical protein U5N28_04020 [Lysinibacillus telephonicus]|uniref:Uncharacterized protein n=1 Tax=Lysinibacillus telephonicus TaxID=1714840 RepID=A0A3S0J313_9BACI|nr:hypothetical protein [Lysinibacillus telephonicus]RTQ92997.1 hypothetical protein EKG35_10075 [Lysinibacillus telephonicus]
MIQSLNTAIVTNTSSTTNSTSINQSKIRWDNVCEAEANNRGEIIESTESVIVNGIAYDADDAARWDEYIEKLDPMFLAFCNLANEGVDINNVTDDNRYSIHFYEFCSMIEKGEVVSEKNAEFGFENFYASNWDIRTELSTYDEGKSDILKSASVLDIIKKCYELGMMTKENRLLFPSELYKIRFEKKMEHALLNKDNIMLINYKMDNNYNKALMNSAYQKSI